MRTAKQTPVSIVFAVALFLTGKAIAENGRLPAESDRIATDSVSQYIDDSQAGWIWSGMAVSDDPEMHGGGAHAGGSGAYGVYTFHGTGIEVYGIACQTITVDGRSHKMGHVKISLDGKPVGGLDTSRPGPVYDFNLFSTAGLADANHVLQIESTGGWIVVDYIKVMSKDAESETEVVNQLGAPIRAGYYRIFPRLDSTMSLSTDTTRPVDGSIVEIDHRSRDHVQVWKLIPVSSDRYRLTPLGARAQGLTLLSEIVSDYAGAQTGTWHYGSLPAAQWYIEPTKDGFYRISPAIDPSRALDVDHGAMKDGSNVIGYGWHGGENQQWGLAPVTP